MPDFKIGAAVALDGDEQFKKQLKEIDRSMSLTRAESKKLSAEFDDVGSSQEALRKKGELLQKQYDDQKKKLDVITEAVKKYETAQKDIKERIDATKSALADAEKNLERTAEQYGKNSEEAKNAAAQVDELTQGLSRQEAQAEKISTSLDSWRSKQIAVETQLVKTKKAISDNETATKKLTDKTQVAAQKMKDFGDSVEKVGEKVDKIGDKTEKLGNSLTTGVTVPLVAIGTAAVASFNEVDDGLDIITQKTGATGEQLKSFETIYKNIGGTINAQFSDIGSAVGEVNTRLELQGDALEQASIDFLKYARVNGTDVNTSIQLVSRAMGDASIESSKYGMVLDSLTKAGQMSGISVDKLAESLAKYGAPLRMLGYEIEDSIALFAAWEKAGVNTEIAFSGMRQAMGRWSSEGKNAQEEFAKLLQQLKDAPDLATAAAIATENFGTEAGNDLADAVRGGRFEVEKYTEALKNSSGTLRSTYAGMTDESDKAAIAMQEAKIALSDIGETILTTGAPLLKDLSEVVKEVGEWFDSLTDEQRENIVKWGALIAIGGPAVSTLGKITKGMGSLVTTVGSGVKKVGDWLAAAKSAKTATEGLESAASVASGSMGTLDNAVGGASGSALKLTGNLASTAASLAGAAGIAVAVGVAVVAFGKYIYSQQDVSKANEAIKSSFDSAAEAAKQYAQDVATIQPTVSLEELTKMDSEEKTAIESQITEVQGIITKISETAASERRELTEEETKRIDELLKKIRSISEEELDAMANGHETYQKRISASVKAFEGSVNEYSEKAKEWYATENSLYEERIAGIKEWETTQIESLESANLSQEEYEKRVAEITKEVTEKEKEAANEHKQTTAIIIDEQMKRSTSLSELLETTRKYNEDSRRLTIARMQFDEAIRENDYEKQQELKEKYGELLHEREKLEEGYNDALLNQLDERTEIELEGWLSSIQTARENGIELTATQEENLMMFLSVWDRLPDDMKAKMQETVEALGYGLDDEGNLVKEGADGLMQIIIDRFGNHTYVNNAYSAGAAIMDGLAAGLKSKTEYLKKTTGEVVGVIDTETRKKYEIYSPSRLAKRRSGQIVEGYAIGLKDNAKLIENASKYVMRIPEEEMNKLSRRAQAAGAMTLPMVSPQAARAQSVDMNAFASVMVKALKDAGLTVQMDAKTVGYLTAPAVGKQLGFDAKRGKRN